MTFVIDSSITLAWVYHDERTPKIERVWAHVASEGGWVPAIWRLEVANALQQGIRRRRIDSAYRDGVLADLIDIPIATDAETNSCAWSETLALADRFRLTLYDACYLELAQRRRLPLATLDRDLREAAVALGIVIAGE